MTKPVAEQVQYGVNPCNLPNELFIDGLEVYISGELGQAPGPEVDADQRLNLTEIYIKK